MSMVLTRAPLEPIGMNAAGSSKRRSARLSSEGPGENEPPTKKSRSNGVQIQTVSTKEQDGDLNAMAKPRKRKVYDQKVDDFTFSKGKGKHAKEPKQPAVRNSMDEQQAPKPIPEVPQDVNPQPVEAPLESASALTEEAPTTAPIKKVRKRFPSTPERKAAEKPARRSKRISDDNDMPASQQQPSPHRAAHAKSHENTDRSPTPEKARPITIEKKRKRGANGVEEEEKTSRIMLPFQDTPVIRRNREMRKSSADGGHRRSSSGMRGKRASSIIDEGRGNGMCDRLSSFDEVGEERSIALSSTEAHVIPTARFPDRRDSTAKPLYDYPFQRATPPPSDLLSVLDASANPHLPLPALPHAEVPTTDFYKHISADLTEPRRMRCLLGWCGTRALPPKPEAPVESTPAANLEYQARWAARVIQEELSKDLVSNGMLSDWFSRDEAAPPLVPLRKKPNPRNITNAAKAEELERELERLKQERASWDELARSALTSVPETKTEDLEDGALSPLRPELLDSPQRRIFEQLQAPSESDISTDPKALQTRLQAIASDLEFKVDQFAHGVHALSVARETGDKVADRVLSDTAEVLAEREKARKSKGGGPDAMDALKALGRVMNKSVR